MFPDNHLAKFASIASLYQEAIAKGLKRDEYQTFITVSLQTNTHQFVSMKVLNQLRKRKSPVKSHPSRKKEAQKPSKTV